MSTASQQLMSLMTPERWVIVCLALLILAGWVCRLWHKAFWARFEERFGFRPNSWEPRDVQQERITTRLDQETSAMRSAKVNVLRLREELSLAEQELDRACREKRTSAAMAAKAGFIIVA